MKTATFRAGNAAAALILSVVLVFFPVRATLPAGERDTGLGVEWNHLCYKEPGIMTERGSLFGVLLAREFDLERFPVRTLFSMAYGKVQYDGGRTTETGGYVPVHLTTENSVINMRATSPWRFRPGSGRVALLPYAGVGYRLLMDDLPTVWGYLREQTYWYVPIGLEMEIGESDETAWTVGGEYDWFLQGYNVSGGDAFTQDGGSGLRLLARARRVWGEERTQDVRVEAFFQTWQVDRSTVSPGGFYEPANKSSQYGISVSVFF